MDILTRWSLPAFVFLALFLQIIHLFLFGFTTGYDPTVDPVPKDGIKVNSPNPVYDIYPLFQDIQAMMFVGFGFLMTFLKKYGFSSVGINMMLCGSIIQSAIFVNGLVHHEEGFIPLNVNSLISAEFALAAVLISFGAVLGKMSPYQYLFMGTIELFFFILNEYVGREIFHVTDSGDSIFVHAFGAYFGLGVSLVFTRRWMLDNSREESSYNSDLFAMIGTTILWVFWPSFNSIGNTNDGRSRAILNTVLSLLGSTVMTFIVTSLLPEIGEDDEENNKRVSFKGRFNMVMIQNSTLAGGVAAGTICDLNIGPHFAVLIGCIAGTISVIGYRFLTPKMNSKIHDTCGVHNLHGMPGVLSAVCGAIFASKATVDNYGNKLGDIFPAMVDKDHPRSAYAQGGYQMAAIGVTLLIAIVGGAITGALLSIQKQCSIPSNQIFDDEANWTLPEEEEKEKQIRDETKIPLVKREVQV